MLPIHVVFLVLLSTFFFVAEAQRKLTRPLPTLAETKGRERANFDCPEEFGYYPHPTDCTQYYVCVFGGALLESCTGGLMYSHELQTCDWPRNVGCDGLELAAAPAPSSQSSSSSGSQTVKSRERSRDKEEIRTESRLKYAPPPPPPPPQPRAVVTSRGQPRQLQNQQEIIKQQLYADVEESLPPAEEVESDRQQRVYRGQPSTVGQVQRDRDGYRHTNSLSSRGEKVEVISFGTQSQLQPYSEDKSSVAPSAQTTTATARSIYNTSQYNHVNHNDNRYDPYYALYDDDVELYKDVDYTPQSNYNSQSSKTTSANVYRGSTSAAREEPSKRGNVAYNSVSQDIYQQPSTVSDYSENAYQDEDNSYRQSSRSSSRFSLRGDRNEINDIEEIPTTKRVTSTPTRKLTTPTTRITTTTQARTIPTKKSIITASSSLRPVIEKERHLRPIPNNTSPEQNTITPVTQKNPFIYPNQKLRPPITDTTPDYTSHEPLVTIEKQPIAYITNQTIIGHNLTSNIATAASKSTYQISNNNAKNRTHPSEVVVPTTYSPSRFLLKLNLSKNAPIILFRPRNENSKPGVTLNNGQRKLNKILKAVRKTLSPITINNELANNGASEQDSSKYLANNDLKSKLTLIDVTPTNSSPVQSSTSRYITHPTTETELRTNILKQFERTTSSEKPRTYPVPVLKEKQVSEILSTRKQTLKQESTSPLYKFKPIPQKDLTTISPDNLSFPSRSSRANSTLKAFVNGSKGLSKCNEKYSNKCKVDLKQRYL